MAFINFQTGHEASHMIYTLAQS